MVGEGKLRPILIPNLEGIEATGNDHL